MYVQLFSFGNKYHNGGMIAFPWYLNYCLNFAPKVAPSVDGESWDEYVERVKGKALPNVPLNFEGALFYSLTSRFANIDGGYILKKIDKVFQFIFNF